MPVAPESVSVEVAEKYLRDRIGLCLDQASVGQHQIDDSTVKLTYNTLSSEHIAESVLSFVRARFPRLDIFVKEIEASLRLIVVRVATKSGQELHVGHLTQIPVPSIESVLSDWIMMEPYAHIEGSPGAPHEGKMTYTFARYSPRDILLGKIGKPWPYNSPTEGLDPKVVWELAGMLPHPDINRRSSFSRPYARSTRPNAIQRINEHLEMPDRYVSVHI
jgi:hypothetical protein